MAKCEQCGAEAGFMLSHCDACIKAYEDKAPIGAQARGDALPVPETTPSKELVGGQSSFRTHVIDVDIPFGSMVILIIKWSFASIPAAIIWAIIYFIIIYIIR